MSDAPTAAQRLLGELVTTPAAQRFARFRQAGGDEDLLVALGDEAERLALVEVSRALAAAEAVVAVADEHGGARARARARRAQAQALAYAGRHVDALATCAAAVAVSIQDAPVEAGRAKVASMHPLGELGRYDEAVAAGEEAHRLLTQAGEPGLAARADFNLGGIHQNRADPRRALFHFDRAAPAFANEPVIAGYLQNNRGEALLSLGQLDAAEAAFAAALSACESAGAGVAAAIAQGNLADLAARRGRLNEALHHFEHARARLEKDAAHSHAARMLGEQAEALETLGLPEDALEAYREALAALDQHGLAWEAARARAGIGRSLLRVGRLDEAESALREAAEGFAALGHDTAAARVDVIRSEAALARGDLPTATQLLETATAALHDDDLDAILLLCQQARLQNARGRHDDAVAVLSSALTKCRQHDIPPLSAQVLHLRAVSQQSRNRPDAAIADLEAAVEQTERIRGALQAERFRAALIGDRLALYHDLIAARLNAKPFDAQRLLAAIEHAKARTLLDAVGEAVESCESRGRDELAARRATLRAELSVLFSQLAEHHQTGKSKLDHEQWRMQVAERERELSRVEQRLASAATNDVAFARPADLQDVRRVLGPSAVALEYFTCSDAVHALTITPDGEHVVHNLAPLPELHEHCRTLQFQLNRAARPGATARVRGERLLEDVRTELAWFHERLIAPLTNALEKVERLTIVPDGELHAVPLHAAWDGSSHLIEQFDIHYVPSAGVLCRLAGRSTSDAPVASAPLVVGVSDDDVPEIEAEAVELTEILGADCLLADDATAARTLERLPRASLIHMACHGFFSRRAAAASGLKLHDRWLSVQDLSGIRLAADLVTLSGCSTGRQALHPAEEQFGLVRGFLSAGVSRALVSLWPAHDKRTRRFMRNFYTMLAESRGRPAQAFSHAARRALQEEPHPYFWAGFVLIGMP